jgi:chorismate mutase
MAPTAAFPIGSDTMAVRERSRTRRETIALARQRARMDRVNDALCALLQRRARLAVEIAAWKHGRGLGIADPARERAMLTAMLSGAPPGFDAAALRRILRVVLRESRALALRAAPRRAAAAPRRGGIAGPRPARPRRA